jgi:aminoglycoside phosphotransferase (APT) family kinase protein
MMADVPGARLAAGRDCEIFAVGTDRVLRRSRDGRSLEAEAAIMRHVAAHGFPVPEVFDARGPEIVMRRIDGPDLLADVRRHPWRLRTHARLLADLHHRLGRIPAPDDLAAPTSVPGDAVVHLDLHPLNVLLGPHGPVVIDWARARRGPPGADVAATWLVLAAAEVPGRRSLARAALGMARRAFLRAFLEAAGRDRARPWLVALAAERASDTHLSRAERTRMHALAARDGAASGPPSTRSVG